MGVRRSLQQRHPRRSTTKPIGTVALLVAILGVYLLELANGGPVLCEAHGFVPAHPTVISALTSLFLHDPTSWFHVGGNLLFLAVFGTMAERELGSHRFLLLFVASGLAGAFMHMVVDPSATTPMVGASGAIFGIMAACAMLRPRALVFEIDALIQHSAKELGLALASVPPFPHADVVTAGLRPPRSTGSHSLWLASDMRRTELRSSRRRAI